MSTPEQMREAVARYVEEIHRAYVAQAMTFPAAVRGRMPLLAPGPLTVAAVGARNLHVLATRDSLGPVREPEVELAGSVEGLSWTLRFFDPVVLPELSLIDESSGPAFGEVRHALGVSTVVYHFVASPGSGLSAHNAAHVGTGLAGGHSAAARDFETIRSRARGGRTWWTRWRARRRPGWSGRTPCWPPRSCQTTRRCPRWPGRPSPIRTRCGANCWPRSAGGPSGRRHERDPAGRALHGA